MRHAHHRGFCHLRVGNKGAFHFGGAHAVARNIDHIIYPASNPVIAIFITAASIASKIDAGEGGEIGLEKTVMIAVNGAHLARPAVLDDKRAFGGAFQFHPVIIDQGRLHAEHGQGGTAGFQRGCAGQRRDHRAAGFGLPPGIDDGAAHFAHHAVIPLPRFGVDRLAHGAQQAQAAAAGAGDVFVPFAHQRPKRGGRCVKNLDLIFVDHLPEAGKIGKIRHPFEHDRGRPVHQRRVDDIAVARHPAYIGRAPIDLARAVIEHIVMGHGGPHRISASGVKHALGLPGRA